MNKSPLNNMHCYKLILAYDGTPFSGWQVQKNANSIQQQVENALAIIMGGDRIRVIGSGRTDAGVHAQGQVAHFNSKEQRDPGRLLVSLNGLLPHEIRVKSIEEVSPSFHSQYSAIGKEYHYHLYLDPVMNPFLRLYTWQVKRKIDRELLEEGARLFVGTHDFTSFANESHSGSAAKNPVRTLYRLEIVPTPGGLRLEFEGNGFLYKMVRNIVGTLVDVASNKRDIEEIAMIFESKDRRKASQAAPPLGLFLMRVDYGAF